MRGAWQCVKHTLGSEAILLLLLSLLLKPVLSCGLCSHGPSPHLRYVSFYPWRACSVRLDKELKNVSPTPSKFWTWNKEKDTIRKRLRGERKPIGECCTLGSPESHLGLGDSGKHDVQGVGHSYVKRLLRHCHEPKGARRQKSVCSWRRKSL